MGVMKANIEKAHQAMLDGDRDEVVRLLADLSSTIDEVMWLRSQAVVSDDERRQLLAQLLSSVNSEYSELASKIIQRENDFERQLSEPPDYKFWTQPTWKERLQKIQMFRFWIIGGIGFFVFSIAGLILNANAQIKQDLTIETIKATQTAVSFQNQTIASYSVGTLQIIEIDYPTLKDITFGDTAGDNYVVASPAAGSQFAAVKLQFTCSIALCANPPEAELNLLLIDGNTVSYEGGDLPFVIGQPPMSRIAQGQSTTGWLVFEIPKGAAPSAILVVTGEDEIPQRIKWIIP